MRPLSFAAAWSAAVRRCERLEAAAKTAALPVIVRIAERRESFVFMGRFYHEWTHRDTVFFKTIRCVLVARCRCWVAATPRRRSVNVPPAQDSLLAKI